ncbi:MAG TPA: glycosyltransferase family A protein [Patescibacteria group bacterium]|nr:glycosyltransferase family A protein [Patescibacteria group bacterium]
MTQPIDQLVSILLPLRNAEETLPACLESLLNQTYESVQIIAIDDNSKDNTYSILRRYRKQDKRLIIARNVKSYGLSVTLNRALKKAKGSYIALMNQADISTPDRIKRQVFYLRRNPKIAVVGTQAAFQTVSHKLLGKSNFPTDHTTISKTFLTSDSFQLESILINRYLLPSDLLKFEAAPSPMLYRSLLAKILPYGMFANLNLQLYVRTRFETKIESEYSRAFRHLELWIKARFVHDTGISLTSLLYPLNNRMRSALSS